eukprot:TRINITY_DN1633_c0_g1_i1.p1 TRINITY_DN1633_c0_g1~~TRINITY_DN1633_c0_g1_i1.p1  ORF type:complete len:335 (-),score=65.12 TRINITY_DN1633_c0_g1_i1:638-1642(-)
MGCQVGQVELHVHIEGCLEPPLALLIARRNSLSDLLPYDTPEKAERFFQYANLQEFLDLRDATLSVMVHEVDFYDVMMLYLQRVAAQNVVHAEIFLDPQVHVRRGVRFATFMQGLCRGLREGRRKFGISAKLIACFMTELSPDDAIATLEQCLPWRSDIVGVGLARGLPKWEGERYPHSAFKAVMDRARAEGLRTTAHAGEEGPASEIWESLEVLKVERVDHGVQCLQDERLLQYLEETQTPLTVCPLSNFMLKVYGGELEDKMRLLLARNICVTVNSDDPPFFGGYVNENFRFWADELGLAPKDIRRLVRNSVEAAFLPAMEKTKMLQQLVRS